MQQLADQRGPRSAANTYRNYLLTVLALILASNYVENFALGLLLQSIKEDLHLSDTQLGLLSGLGYALFYSIMGIPIARWADRGNRVHIISITAALWSAAVALCGLANSFVQLLLIRVGVGVGEAGCIPPAHSLIAAHFSRAKRPWAVSRYMLGAPLSILIGYLVAGWLNEAYGWRVTFALLGLPGVALAVLAWFTLREPRRKRTRTASSASMNRARAEPPLPHVFGVLWGTRTFRHLLLFHSVVYFFGFGIQKWQPTFFIRSFGLGTGELGTWFALIFGFGGVLGTLLGGNLASRYAADNESLQLKAMAVAYSSIGAISACMYLAPDHRLAFGLLSLIALGGAITIGPLFATIQTLVPENMRATSIAIIYLFANLIGMGLGPLAAGALSDAFKPMFGDESLRYALVVLCPGYLWGGWHLWRASEHARADLDARRAIQRESPVLQDARSDLRAEPTEQLATRDT